jgi:hypothetical protein
MRAGGRLRLWLLAASIDTVAAGPAQAGIGSDLRQLGGKPCPDGSEFTRVSLTVPEYH